MYDLKNCEQNSYSIIRYVYEALLNNYVPDEQIFRYLEKALSCEEYKELVQLSNIELQNIKNTEVQNIDIKRIDELSTEKKKELYSIIESDYGLGILYEDDKRCKFITSWLEKHNVLYNDSYFQPGSELYNAGYMGIITFEE